MSFLEVTGIWVEEAGNTALQHISFAQQEFEKIAIAGETGSGKSTLLKTIAGLVQPSAGEVRFEQEKVIGPAEKLVPGHPGIAYLSQHFELPHSLRVEQVLRYANTLSASGAGDLYEICRISHLLTRRTNQLSGGERQRIALARLLIGAPRLLLLDEPFSSLDTAHKNILKAVIRDIGEELDITCTLISHDPLDTLSWADQVLVLREGRLLQQGTPEQVYRQPADEYTAALFGSYNLLGPAAARALAPLPGIQANGSSSLLIRPENIHMVPEGIQALPVRVNKVRFFGSYYEVEVLLQEVPLTLRTTTLQVAEGDTVHIAVAAPDVWPV